MKKLLTAFVTAALLMVCLCVPAFAADSEFCGCDFANPYVFLLTSEDDHYIYCILHSKEISFLDYSGQAYPHSSDSCTICGSNLDRVFDYRIFHDDYLPLTLCESFGGSGSGCSGVLGVRYDANDHYMVCPDCGAKMSFAYDTGVPVPHLGDDCQTCLEVSAEGFEIYGPLSSDSPGVLPSITTLVTASIDWLTAFALCIISTPLFLIFVCCIFVGLGIALIKRSIHL